MPYRKIYFQGLLVLRDNWIAQIQDLNVLKPSNFYKIAEKSDGKDRNMKKITNWFSEELHLKSFVPNNRIDIE